ncbi:MAG: hypothetical protein PWQ50_1949 [Methanolobus sp.]|nr:hypothetical protein [Methanolobus sp.]
MITLTRKLTLEDLERSKTPVERKVNIQIVDTDERELIALRGSLEVVRAAEKFLHEELQAWIES